MNLIVVAQRWTFNTRGWLLTTLAGVQQLQKRYHPLIHSTKAGMLHKQASIQLTIYQYQILENIHLIERSEFTWKIKR